MDGKQNKTPPKSKQREKKIHIDKIACESLPRTDKPWRPEELINLGHQESAESVQGQQPTLAAA